MERETSEERHWEKIAWWLTGISLIPAMTTAIIGAAATGTGPEAYGIAASSLGAAAWLAMLWNVLWAGAASLRSETAGDKRKAALKTAWGFGTAALAMVGSAALGIVWSLV